MKLIYSGKTKEFTPELEKKVSVKLAKLSKFIEQRGEREIHLTHQVERHLHKIEISMNFYDHAMVGEGLDADLPTAVHGAIEKLEKQLLKLRTRWRDTHRHGKSGVSAKEGWAESAPADQETPVEKAPKVSGNGAARKPKIFRVNYQEDRKPMTLDEAVLEMEKDLDYVVYRDSKRNRLSVLLRRPDGNFDLIES